MSDYQLELRRAGELVDLGRVPQAMDVLLRLLREYPDLAGHTQNVIAVAHMREGRQADAVKAAQEAVAGLPDSAEAHHILGMALRRVDRPKQAIVALDRAAELDPQDSDIHQQRAEVLSDLRRHQEAFEAASTAVNLAPEDADAHFSMGYVLQETNPTTAERAYAAALELEPSHAGALHNLSTLRITRGRADDGARGLADVLAQSPQMKLPVTALDQLLVSAIWRNHLITFLSMWVIGGFSGFLYEEDGLPAALVLVPVLALVGGLVWSTRKGVLPIRNALPMKGSRFLKGFARREKIATLWAVLVTLAVVLTVVCAVVAAVVASSAPTMMSSGFGIMMLFVGAALSWIRAPLVSRRAKRERLQ